MPAQKQQREVNYLYHYRGVKHIVCQEWEDRFYLYLRYPDSWCILLFLDDAVHCLKSLRSDDYNSSYWLKTTPESIKFQHFCQFFKEIIVNLNNFFHYTLLF
jgi:hypothetical protein